MGSFTWPVRLESVDGERAVDIDAMVDTGASYSVAPSSLLEQLGVRRIDSIRLSLADGSSVVYDIGRAIASIDGRRESTLVLFGGDDSRALLGAYTLEGLRLTVDPVHMRLVPLTSAWL